MAESSFEFALERMFADTPARPDADIFAARVLERLDRGWTTRRLLIGSMGALGGLVGAYQILGVGTMQQLSTAASRSNDFFAQQLTHSLTSVAPASIAQSGFAQSSFSVGGQAIWMVAALALVAAGLGLARLVREI